MNSTIIDVLQDEALGLDNLERDIDAASYAPQVVKTRLKRLSALLDQAFLMGHDIRELVYTRSAAMDRILLAIWNSFSFPDTLSLIAVGGYGRGELHPYSDIDVLILSEQPFDDVLGESISSFVTLLWDLQLEIGYSVRTPEECLQGAIEDVTIATNLLENRLIAGSSTGIESVTASVYSDAVYTSADYYRAKQLEQSQRRERYSGTEYNLEPNLKSSPGSLRDLQTIAWITKRHFGRHVNDPRERYGFLTETEYKALVDDEATLWQFRYGLHMLAERSENRLLFGYQRKLAEILGYQDGDKLAVEQMMQRYYRAVMRIAQLADVILAYFDDYYLSQGQEDDIVPLNKRFQLKNHYLDVVELDTFEKSPYAILEVFLYLAQNPFARGITARTIRLIQHHRDAIDDDFRSDIATQSLFMEILRTPHALDKTLNAMLRFGVLGRYLPEFGKIVGQMQHDLFHTLTVDAHTIQLIKNIVDLEKDASKEHFPLASRLLKYIPKRELLFVAGLYHDIAKGRGGNHSILGAEDAIAFCERHHLSERDTQLVNWMVENHLLMSMTSQKKDISDPDVIEAFAQLIPSLTHLQYLYILTVCDIAATNASLWTSWRSSLMQQLYIEARRVIRRGGSSGQSKDGWIHATKREVINILDSWGLSGERVSELISTLNDAYFLQDSTNEIAWQLAQVIAHGESEEPLVTIKNTQTITGEGFTEIMIYVKSSSDVFAATASALEQLNFNILNARVSAGGEAFSLSHFAVTDMQGKPLPDQVLELEHMRKSMIDALLDNERCQNIVERPATRQQKHFSFPTEVIISNDPINQWTVVDVVTPDRPGLLAKIGRVFRQHAILVKNARIATLGERVEDVFFITNLEGQPISNPALCETLVADLCHSLDEKP